MGSRNRHRKADKLRRRQQASAPRPPRVGREVIYAAVVAYRRPDPGAYRELLVRLAADGPRTAVELEAFLGEAVQAAQADNWDSREIIRQTERRLGSRHARYASEVVDGHAGRDRLTTLDSLAIAIEVLALLLALPPLPKLGGFHGPGRRPRSEQDARVLEKVRALLAKAESTTFPEEAEALSAKAQELMARHAIDEAMVGAAAGRTAEDAPGGLRVAVDDPYAKAKSILLSEVALANRCSAVWSEGVGFSTVFGYESDLEFVEVLYTSLLVQATSAMVAAGSQFDRYGRSRTRSFRQSFLLAYGNRIGQRLREAEAAVQAAAEEEYGEALLPVLADRSAAVDAAREAAFPGAVKRPVSVTNAAGWAAGSAAADLASLTGRTEMPAAG